MQNDKLLPCPFCGGEAKIEWEAWKDISETSGVYGLFVNHSRECFFKRMVGMPRTHEMIGSSEEYLIETWNTRKPMERIVEQLEEIERKTFRMSPKDAIEIVKGGCR